MDHMGQDLAEDDILRGNEDVMDDDHGSHGMRVDADQDEKLMAEAEREFFPGCDGFSILTAMVLFMHVKVLNHWTNISFDMFLEEMNQVCPKPNNIPASFYAANKMLKGLGLGYENIYELYALSFGLDDTVSTFTSCIVSGICWHVKQLEETKVVQNSGIMVLGLHGDRASDFYGSLVSVVKLNFIYMCLFSDPFSRSMVQYKSF